MPVNAKQKNSFNKNLIYPFQFIQGNKFKKRNVPATHKAIHRDIHGKRASSLRLILYGFQS